MTENEARTKWCPMVRHKGETATFNRGWELGNAVNQGRPGDGYNCACIASKCMMWRWTNEVTGRGFCGLAGRDGA